MLVVPCVLNTNTSSCYVTLNWTELWVQTNGKLISKVLETQSWNSGGFQWVWSFLECTFHCTAEHLDNVIENQLFQLQSHILNSLIMWLKTRSSSCSIKNEKHFMLPSYLRTLLLLLVESHVKRLSTFECFDAHTWEIRMIRSWQHTVQTHKQLPCQYNSIKFNVWKSWKHDHECCLFVPSSLYQWRHKQGWHVWQSYEIGHKSPFFCFSLVKSEPAWLGLEELRL